MRDGRGFQHDRALLGELEGVRQQVFQDLKEARLVGHDHARQVVTELHLQRQPLVGGHVGEQVLQRLADAGQRHVGRVGADRARLDLRQVENVVDQVQEVVAGSVDGAGVSALLLGQVALGVVPELIGQQ